MAPQNDTNFMEGDDPSIEFGKILANPPLGEEIVITGISGKYPSSSNVHEFRDNLFNKADMVSDDHSRWKPGHPEIPQRTGKIPLINRFDAGFFGIHYRHSTQMDPIQRMLLEIVVEALFDAGIHPSDLENTNTGVFIGACFSEIEKTWFTDKLVPKGFAIIGNERSFLAHRLSEFLKLKGPSYNCDTACSSSLYALENAYKAMRMGQCDIAIVGGSNLCLHPFVSLQFARLGVLSPDGSCKAFDKSGNGYARSETIAAIILQKSKDAKRIYATILHAKTNCDGYKNSGITYPSGEMQTRLLKEFYQECASVSPNELSFLEAHGTGTKVGDPEELQAIDQVFTKGRQTPLLIGSVKSNIGHTEPSSGLCSITKALIAAETGFIPPNLHFKQCRPGIKGLEEGRLKVVTEKMPFMDNKGIIGINSFGFGGGNCHVLLKHNTKVKVNNGRALDNIPRLVCVSGRNRKAIHALFDDVLKNNVDIEQIRLLQEIFRKPVANHLYRGYSLLSQSGEIIRSLNHVRHFAPKLVLCFGNIDKATINRAKEFLELPVASSTLEKINEVLKPKRINILTILTNPISSVLETTLANFALEVVFADLITACDIVPDKIFGITRGFSLGNLVCAYFDTALTLEEATECAYQIAEAANSVSRNINGTKDLSTLINQSDKVATKLQQTLTNILKKPRRLNKKVIFDGTPLEISSVYLTNCFNGNKILNEVKNVFKSNWALLEIGNGEVGKVLTKELGCNNEKFIIRCDGDINAVLAAFGKLYEIGFNPQIQHLFPTIQFPVSRGTPMIAPHIQWNHEREWWVTTYQTELIDIEEKIYSMLMNDTAYVYIRGHVIDGRNLLPATFYLQLAWETLAHIHGLMITDLNVIFENCKFKRATPVAKDNVTMELIVMIQRGSGNFEIVEGGVPVVTGRIYQKNSAEILLDDIPMPSGVHKERAPYMTKKDIYKELRLRGYNYSGEFKALQSCDSSASVGTILWSNNWVTFIDNMLQMKILQEDTRLLYVPTTIEKLTIDVKRHIEFAQKVDDQNTILNIYASRETGIVRSGYVEVRGLQASSIARRRNVGTPVIEKNVFVPNQATIALEKAVRVNLQILLENMPHIKVKVVELIDDATSDEVKHLGDLVFDVLADQPLIQPDITILSKSELEVENVKVEDKKLLTEVECSLVIASKLFQRNNILQLALGSLKENGFVISRESKEFEPNKNLPKEISIVTVFTNENEKLILFRKAVNVPTFSTLKISSEDNEFTWVSKLQNSLMKNEGNVLLYSQGEPLNGILGMISCLKREPSGKNARLVFLPDSAPEFDPSLPFYREQLNKNLAFNIFKNNQWGTYRHLLLEENKPFEAEHCYLNSIRRGDLSSLTWLEGPLQINKKTDPEHTLIQIHYAAINFRDVMTATGRINADSITRDRREQECVQGFEFSGLTESGKRVMGMVVNGACASIVKADSILLWNVPDNWTLQEAVTVPVVYGTSLFGLIIKGKIKRGDTVLIHSGTGGVGLAAIQLALHIGCTVYTTVGTPEKRTFLKERFPQLKDHHISNSRTTEFEDHIMKMTHGKGVDIVLNSLAEEKLIASVRCLAQGGRFIEIGKFDLANDNTLNLLLMEKGASFHGVMIDALMNESPHRKIRLHACLQELIDNGAVKPLPTTVFKMNEPEAAFRYMTTGKHMGKVLIEIRKEQKSLLKPMPITKFLCTPRYYCEPDKTYIICGGLGGFGLELADWLVLRGCQNLVLTSRAGIKTGYQASRIRIWRSYGCTVNIDTNDITTYEGCMDLIKSSNKLGPVHAVFNLAVVLKDCIFENQSDESFKTSFGPKANATKYLDEITRKLCPYLRDFVVFSSVSCGRGNAGQTNYGMSNSVMERICEKRKSEGLPALAIQWGAIGDVGLVADMQEEAVDIEIGGTLQQRISNCLEVMDKLLRQDEAAIISSIVVAEKKSRIGGANNIVDAVAVILGVKELKSVSLQATLAEIGMDSMTAVEIKQTLEREYDVFLTPQDIKTMTFAKLIDIQTERDAEKQTGIIKERALAGMDMILRMIPDETTSKTLILPIEGKPDLSKPNSTVILLPGIEGLVEIIQPLYKQLAANLVGLQFTVNQPGESIEEIAQIYVPIVEQRISKDKPFNLLIYSWGSAVGFQLVHLLEQKGYSGTVICIDGAPNYLKALTKLLEVESDEKLQVSLLIHLVTMQHPYELIAKHVESLLKCDTFDDKIKLAQSVVPSSPTQTPQHQNEWVKSLYNRLKALIKWTPEFKLKSKIVLIKPTLVSIDTADEISGLERLCEQPLEVRTFDGNHVSVLENPNLARTVNEIFGLVDIREESSEKANKE